MFTGIIHGIGTILEIKRMSKQLLIKIRPALQIKDWRLGESIAVNGCCLTVTKFSEFWFEAYISSVTFYCTNLRYLRIKEKVNLERSLKLDERVGGHIVTGHVDEVGQVKNVQLVGASRIVTVTISDKNSKFLITRGSIVLDGISLTIVECDKEWCKVNLIPETLSNTTALMWHVGSMLNIETDALVKATSVSKKQNLTFISKNFLFEHGYL